MKLKQIEAAIQRKIDPDFQFADNRNQEIPFTPLNNPISDTTIAIISSGGFYRQNELPFDTNDIMGDATYREIPRNVAWETVAIAHTHYDHRYVNADMNCAFPLQLLDELEAEGVIGKSAEAHYSFCGYVLKIKELTDESTPQIINRLRETAVDAVILAPV